MKITLIPATHIDSMRAVVQPLLEKAEPYSGKRYTGSDMVDDAISGQAQLWVIFDETLNNEIVAACTTKVMSYPRGKALCCQFCGGERMQEWIDLVDETFARFAKDMGCAWLELTGRLGWLRVLPLSWRKEFYVYRRDIKEPDGQGK